MGMELLISPTSPYARKAWITAIELGLEDRLRLREANPMTDPAVKQANPLGKVPALLRDGDSALFDSDVICVYFDQLAGGRLTPADPTARIDDLRRHALATGVTDAAVSRVMESRRPDGERSTMWVERWLQAIRDSVAALEQMGAPDATFSTLGSIATATALGYLDFRLAEQVRWRDFAPALKDWFAAIEARPSFVKTKPA